MPNRPPANNLRARSDAPLSSGVKSSARARKIRRVVWSVGDTTLTLKSGAPPKELAKATGQE